MGKTADLPMIQKTNIDILHKEGKSQKVITEGGITWPFDGDAGLLCVHTRRDLRE